ncbi:hypothetical protein AB0C07_14740 [Actinoplanes missouriensis]|uniref:hypothetical protein n=1 Tax=Actinoplanes missouriensis TaxID=1866 RepID=UPI0033CA521A
MRRVSALLIAALVVVPAAPASAAAASAAPVSAAPASVTWTVQPATAEGPDGRRWVERTLDPGSVVTEHLAVRNFSDAPASFTLTAADGYLTGKGRFNMLPSDRKSVDGGTWITVRESVTVGAGKTAVVPFTITVPRDATPGDHPAGIAASVAGRQGTVQVESRVGFRVLMRASGEVRPALAVRGVSASYERSWNPFAPGELTVSYQAANTGNVRLDLADRVSTSELFGLVSATGASVRGELLPGGESSATTRVGGVWGLGPVRTTVRLDAAATASTTVTTWVAPWPQLFLLVAAVLIVLAWRARSRRLTALLEEARREGARSAA